MHFAVLRAYGVVIGRHLRLAASCRLELLCTDKNDEEVYCLASEACLHVWQICKHVAFYLWYWRLTATL